MSLPAIRAVRNRFPEARISVLARPWVADLYARETVIDRVIPYAGEAGVAGWAAKCEKAAALRAEGFDCAILLQNAFEAALIARLARIPRRIGYARDGRGWLLTDPIPVPQSGQIPRHERFYYLELLRRSRLIDHFPPSDSIELAGAGEAAQAGAEHFRELGIAQPVIGISPGAAYGNAKRWLPERFAHTAARLASSHSASIALFGSGAERGLCESIANSVGTRRGKVWNLAGKTTLRQFIDMAAACRLFLTNDSGAMHIASALGIPTITIFGATDHTGTGPTGRFARVIRQQVECSPCMLRECPIDHRCMTRVSAEEVAAAADGLWAESEKG
jgi:heptosyltransferase-2